MNNGIIDQISGKMKETLGKITGDKHAETEGKVENKKGHAKAKLEDLQDHAEDKVNDAKDMAKGAMDGLHDDKDE